LIRLAIERSLSLSPPFTGEHNAPDISLTGEIVNQLLSRLDLELASMKMLDGLRVVL
jgi:hypothetical protein